MTGGCAARAGSGSRSCACSEGVFGYVRPPDLPLQERERFTRMYCGLCHALGCRYGPAAQMILNYDFTYLAILLSDGEEGTAAHSRCLPHPVHGRDYRTGDPALDLAADESVILAYWQARDGAADHGLFRGTPYRAASGALRQAYRKAAAARPAFDEAVRTELARLAALERENCPSLDRPADTFAKLLSGAAGEVEHPIRRRVLEQLLYHMGRWIYLVDAADDLKKDAASGNYNPVALRFDLTDGVWTADARAEFAATLDHSIHQMTTAFELWDFGVWRPILESTLYTGLFQVGKAVLDGTFRTGRAERKKPKKDEDP